MKFAKIFLLFFAIPLFAFAQGKIDDFKNVVFIGSYHDNHIWTQNVRDAVERTFDSAGRNVAMRNIYLDAKNTTDKVKRRDILKAMLGDCADVDLIIVSDFEAAETLADISSGALLHIPKVFATINPPNLSAKIFGSRDEKGENATLCVEEIGVEETFLAARKLLPNAKNVYVWADKTDTGSAYLEAARAQLAKYSKGANIFFGINANSDTDILDIAKNLPEDSFVIFLTWQKDDTGTYRNPEIFYPALAKACSAPIFTVIDNIIEGGFVGGIMSSATKNGEFAAQKALEIFDGKKKSGAFVEVVKPVAKFNQEALLRWNLPQNVLPSDAQIVKEKRTFLETYLWGTLATSVFVAFLIFVILVELYFFVKYKNVSDKYQKLFKRNEVILHAIPLGIELYDGDGFLISANDVDCQIFGVDRKLGFGEGVLNIFKDPNISETTLKNLKSGMPVCAYIDYDFEKVKSSKYFTTTRRGIKHIECNAAPVFNAHGQIESYVFIFQDISLRYAHEQSVAGFARNVNLAVDAANAGLWYLDAKTCEFTLISGAGRLKNGISLDDCTLLVAPEMRDEFRRSFEDLLEGRLLKKTLFFYLRNPENNSANFVKTSMAAVVENGAVIGIAGTLGDVDSIGVGADGGNATEAADSARAGEKLQK